jgi:hypothetical protein
VKHGRNGALEHEQRPKSRRSFRRCWRALRTAGDWRMRDRIFQRRSLVHRGAIDIKIATLPEPDQSNSGPLADSGPGACASRTSGRCSGAPQARIPRPGTSQRRAHSDSHFERRYELPGHRLSDREGRRLKRRCTPTSVDLREPGVAGQLADRSRAPLARRITRCYYDRTGFTDRRFLRLSPRRLRRSVCIESLIRSG